MFWVLETAGIFGFAVEPQQEIGIVGGHSKHLDGYRAANAGIRTFVDCPHTAASYHLDNVIGADSRRFGQR
jgi:hypothetical protein